jgi:very-short-patch-repair endonuclease
MARKRAVCTNTSLNKIESSVCNILTSLQVSFTTQTSVDKYNVDFLVDNKYIIECYGDFWHCNPNKYAPSYFNRGKRKTATEIWKRDCDRKTLFEEQGYRFLALWENDITQHPKKVRTNIKRFLKNNEG